MAPDAAIPTVVLGGYLGAGKTTLVNRLLRQAAGPAPRRIAVLVNDFGEVAIDADLVVGAEGDVLSLAGGCVCCAIGADLVGALRQVAARAPPPQAVLVETSGVGLPAAVARTAALVPELRVENIVVVADAAALRRQADQRYVGSTVRRQLHEADLVLIAKADLVAAPALAELQAWLPANGVTAPSAALPPPMSSTPGAPDDLVSSLVFGPADGEWTDSTRRHTEPRRSAFAAAQASPRLASPAFDAAASRFVAQTHRFAAPLDVAVFAEALRQQGVLRAKGHLLDCSGRWLEVQLAGGRIHCQPAAARAALPAGQRADEAAGRLVAITLRAA